MTETFRNINHAALGVTAVKREQYPDSNRIEIAFAGKSNVGKSSMINTMLNRKALVRTSGSPGKTRTINFFEVEEEWYFVDLPGYGYAKVSKSVSSSWGKMIEDYLRDRAQLKALVLLLDIRHEPGTHDRMMYDWCKYYNLQTILVATKSDKVKRSQLQKCAATLRKGLGATEEVIPFSSLERTGRERLWELFDSYLTLE